MIRGGIVQVLTARWFRVGVVVGRRGPWSASKRRVMVCVWSQPSLSWSQPRGFAHEELLELPAVPTHDPFGERVIMIAAAARSIAEADGHVCYRGGRTFVGAPRVLEPSPA